MGLLPHSFTLIQSNTSISIGNHTVFLVQFGINLHECLCLIFDQITMAQEQKYLQEPSNGLLVFTSIFEKLTSAN